MPRYVFKIIAHADRPNKVLVGQLLPGYTHMVFSKKFSEVSMGAWGKLWTLCPEEIDWASVTHLEIMYDELPYRDLVHPTGIWTYNIEFDDGTITLLCEILKSKELNSELHFTRQSLNLF